MRAMAKIWFETNQPEVESAKGGRGKTSKILEVCNDDERAAMQEAIRKAPSSSPTHR
jgi:hypothetical protein